MPSHDAVSTARRTILQEAEALARLASRLDENLLAVLDLISHCRGHVLVTGAGTSRAIADRFAHLLSCCGTPALSISAADSLHGASGAVTSQDLVFVISKGGRSAEVNQFARIAKERGATLVAQTENPESPLAALCDAVYLVQSDGQIDPYGMIALGSSLVNAAAGDALCAALLEMNQYSLEQFGRTHPGGAVGRALSAGMNPIDQPEEGS